MYLKNYTRSSAQMSTSELAFREKTDKYSCTIITICFTRKAY